MVWEACLDDTIPSAPLFGLSVCDFVDFYSLVAWDPSYVYEGIIVSLQEFESMFREKDGKLLGWMGVCEGDDVNTSVESAFIFCCM